MTETRYGRCPEHGVVEVVDLGRGSNCCACSKGPCTDGSIRGSGPSGGWSLGVAHHTLSALTTLREKGELDEGWLAFVREKVGQHAWCKLCEDVQPFSVLKTDSHGMNPRHVCSGCFTATLQDEMDWRDTPTAKDAYVPAGEGKWQYCAVAHDYHAAPHACHGDCVGGWEPQTLEDLTDIAANKYDDAQASARRILAEHGRGGGSIKEAKALRTGDTVTVAGEGKVVTAATETTLTVKPAAYLECPRCKGVFCKLSGGESKDMTLAYAQQMLCQEVDEDENGDPVCMDCQADGFLWETRLLVRRAKAPPPPTPYLECPECRGDMGDHVRGWIGESLPSVKFGVAVRCAACSAKIPPQTLPVRRPKEEPVERVKCDAVDPLQGTLECGMSRGHGGKHMTHDGALMWENKKPCCWLAEHDPEEHVALKEQGRVCCVCIDGNRCSTHDRRPDLYQRRLKQQLPATVEETVLTAHENAVLDRVVVAIERGDEPAPLLPTFFPGKAEPSETYSAMGVEVTWPQETDGEPWCVTVEEDEPPDYRKNVIAAGPGDDESPGSLRGIASLEDYRPPFDVTRAWEWWRGRR